MKALILSFLLMFSAAASFADEMPDPTLGQKLQQIHERGMQYKAGKLKATASPADLERVRKALEVSSACTPNQTQALGKKKAPCPHCGWIKCGECSAALAAAIAACGGPEDLPCIAASLGAMASCLGCLVK